MRFSAPSAPPPTTPSTTPTTIRPRSSRPARAALGLATLVAMGGLAACSADADPPSSGRSGVVQPGRPGEASSTLGADASAEHAEVAHDDVAYVQMMIPHHQQALTMSRLAPSRASSPAVKAMAARILASQGPEILTMAAWLDAHDVSVPRATDAPSAYDHGEHGHASMHGMLTAAQLDELRAARGARFDRLYLEGMIGHHEGAITMADEVAVKGSDVQVAEMAADVITGQQAEIERMRQVLAAL